jgi:predicted GIY-YIG superfamily endonuclease
MKPLVLYRFFDQDDNLLYVGITNSPWTRFNQHRSDKSWFFEILKQAVKNRSEESA